MSDLSIQVIGWGESNSTIWQVLTTNWVKFVDFHGFNFFGPFCPKLLGFLDYKDLNFFESCHIRLDLFFTSFLLKWAFKLCLKQYLSKLIFPSRPVPFKMGLQDLLEAIPIQIYTSQYPRIDMWKQKNTQ